MRKAEELKAISLASAMETVEKLEVKLAEFAKTHKHAIQHDPAFRAKFLDMCAPLGVDPLSAEKGFWGSMLGIGEFYYELSVKVAEVCLASRTRNGGIIRVSEVKDILTQRGTKFSFADSKSKSSYSEDDIITSVKKLSKLGSGFRTINVGKAILIVSVPEELDDDHMEVMNVAEDDGYEAYGVVTTDSMERALGWDEERSNRALELLLGKGMVWLDVHRGEKKYWFPSLWKQGSSTPNK
mmetsp:Transcript_8475/g.15328  ORF Transcript_8475/g.15328 Transcript_8475/m.15328 type:complete len:240 (+) Transcript_8475:43-762(+)